MLFCISCNTFQHSVCFGKAINEYNTAVQEGSVCLQCAVENSQAICHDPSMVNLAADQVKAQCLYRQCLYFLLKSKSIFVSKTTLRLQLNIGYTELHTLCTSLIKDRQENISTKASRGCLGKHDTR
uniref:Zinc finger PHD-type domain-containing protein n=1 Tax=Trichuris muris TaxID=70415 RepID=A0A5S6Q190_TRIMR